MGYNVLSGSISSIHNINASGTFTGSFGGDGTNLENVTQFQLFGDTSGGRIPFFKDVCGVKHLEGDNTCFFNAPTDTLILSKLSASSGINLSGIDYISPDISKSYKQNNGNINEVNSGPSMKLHHECDTKDNNSFAIKRFVSNLF